MTKTEELTPTAELEAVLERSSNKLVNPARSELIARALKGREAFAAACGALATWTPAHSTGQGRPVAERPAGVASLHAALRSLTCLTSGARL